MFNTISCSGSSNSNYKIPLQTDMGKILKRLTMQRTVMMLSIILSCTCCGNATRQFLTKLDIPEDTETAFLGTY